MGMWIVTLAAGLAYGGIALWAWEAAFDRFPPSRTAKWTTLLFPASTNALVATLFGRAVAVETIRFEHLIGWFVIAAVGSVHFCRQIPVEGAETQTQEEGRNTW